MDMTNLQKMRLTLKTWLITKEYYKARKAMRFAEKLHSGTRKDGVTPEFAHQIWIANVLRTLPIPDDMMENIIAVAFLHDTAEDAHVGFEELEVLFGKTVTDAVRRLTKVHRGVKVPPEVYFAGIAACPIAALVKGVDRLHNLSSMVGVFTIEKQIAYISEAVEHIMPALKEARNDFDVLERAFENIKTSLLSRISLIQEIHKATKANATVAV